MDQLSERTIVVSKNATGGGMEAFPGVMNVEIRREKRAKGAVHWGCELTLVIQA